MKEQEPNQHALSQENRDRARRFLGIGLACAHRLANEGARVLNADVREPTAEAQSTFKELPGEWQWIQANLGDREIPQQIVQRAVSLWGGIDVLINNAAFVSDQSGATLDASLEQWERQFVIAVTRIFLMSKLCIPEMIKRGGGAIVDTSSIGGINPFNEGAAFTVPLRQPFCSLRVPWRLTMA